MYKKDLKICLNQKSGVVPSCIKRVVTSCLMRENPKRIIANRPCSFGQLTTEQILLLNFFFMILYFI